MEKGNIVEIGRRFRVVANKCTLWWSGMQSHTCFSGGHQGVWWVWLELAASLTLAAPGVQSEIPTVVMNTIKYRQ